MNAPPRVRIDWRRPGGRKPPGVVICSRPGRWGNPFVVGRHAETAAECVELFRRYVMGRGHHTLTPERIRAELATATGLACYCDLAEPCHVDVIRAILSEAVK